MKREIPIQRGMLVLTLLLSLLALSATVEATTAIFTTTKEAVTWNKIEIVFRDTGNTQIYDVTPGQTFYVNVTVNGVGSDTDDTMLSPIVKLSLPSGMEITPRRKTEALGVEVQEHNVIFWQLEVNGLWYTDSMGAGNGLADNLDWTTGWTVTADDHLLPDNYTISVAAYDYGVNEQAIPLYYQGWGNRNSTTIEVLPTISTFSIGVNASVHEISEDGSVNVTGFLIGDTVKINGSIPSNAKVNLTLWHPHYSIAEEWSELTQAEYAAGVNYGLTEKWDRRGIYFIEGVAYNSTAGTAWTRGSFRVGTETPQYRKDKEDTTKDYMSFLSMRIPPPGLRTSCGDCHTAIFWNMTTTPWITGIAPSDPDTHKEHPNRAPPTKNPKWVHSAHDPLPEMNESRSPNAFGAAAVYDGGTRVQVSPGEISVLANWDNDGGDSSPDHMAIVAMYANPWKSPSTYGDYAWDTCSFCHNVKNTRELSSGYDPAPTCMVGGDNPGCHLVDRAGTHEIIPTCSACHVPAGGTMKDIELPKCEKCHSISNIWMNDTGVSQVLAPDGVATTKLDANDYTAGDATKAQVMVGSGENVTIYIDSPYRDAAIKEVYATIDWAIDIQGGVGTDFSIRSYYLNGNDVWVEWFYSGPQTNADVVEIVNQSNNLKGSDPKDPNYLSISDDGKYSFRVEAGPDLNSADKILVDYFFIDFLADDDMSRIGAHEGVKCINCHGTPHNATKDIYCTTCKGQRLKPTGTHVWKKTNSTGGDLIQEINTSLWCTECHGGEGHGAITNTPKCSKCHNRNESSELNPATDESWTRWSPSKIPPWGLPGIHGRSGYDCKDCHRNHHEAKKPSCGEYGDLEVRCHVANMTTDGINNITINYENINATWNSSNKEHVADHVNDTYSFNYTLENHAFNPNKWASGQYFGARCAQCHDNETVEVSNKSGTTPQNLTMKTLIHATNSTEYRPDLRIKLRNTSYTAMARFCVDCHTGYNDSLVHADNLGGNPVYSSACDNCHYGIDNGNLKPAMHSATVIKNSLITELFSNITNLAVNEYVEINVSVTNKHPSLTYDTVSIVGGALVIIGTAGFNNVLGPIPSTPQSIAPFATINFTFVYQATSEGTARFRGQVQNGTANPLSNKDYSDEITATAGVPEFPDMAIAMAMGSLVYLAMRKRLLYLTRE